MSLKYEYKYMYISDLLTFHIIIAVPNVVPALSPGGYSIYNGQIFIYLKVHYYH